MRGTAFGFLFRDPLHMEFLAKGSDFCQLHKHVSISSAIAKSVFNTRIQKHSCCLRSRTRGGMVIWDENMTMMSSLGQG